MAVFKLSVGPKGGAPNQEVTDFATASIKRTLREGSSATLSIPGNGVTARQVDGLATDLWVHRNNAPFERLRFLPVAQSWGPSGEDTASLIAVSYKKLVYGRHLRTPLSFVNVAQTTIVWDLVNHAQGGTGGALGLTAGTLATGTPRDRTEFKVGDNLGKLLTDLANVIDGPWWDVSGTLVVDSKPFTAFATIAQPFILGVNVLAMSTTPGDYANAAFGSGSALQTILEYREAAGLAADPRGRWETIGAWPSVTTQAVVEQHTLGLLAAGQHPLADWVLELDPTRHFTDSFVVPGNYITIRVPRTAVDAVGAPAATVKVQVTEVDYTIDQDGNLTVGLAGVEVPA